MKYRMLQYGEVITKDAEINWNDAAWSKISISDSEIGKEYRIGMHCPNMRVPLASIKDRIIGAF